MAELEDEARMREKDLTLALDDSRRSERKLDDMRHSLELQLEATGNDMNDLKVSGVNWH